MFDHTRGPGEMTRADLTRSANTARTHRFEHSGHLSGGEVRPGAPVLEFRYSDFHPGKAKSVGAGCQSDEVSVVGEMLLGTNKSERNRALSQRIDLSGRSAALQQFIEWPRELLRTE